MLILLVYASGSQSMENSPVFPNFWHGNNRMVSYPDVSRDVHLLRMDHVPIREIPKQAHGRWTGEVSEMVVGAASSPAIRQASLPEYLGGLFLLLGQLVEHLTSEQHRESFRLVDFLDEEIVVGCVQLQ